MQVVSAAFPTGREDSSVLCLQKVAPLTGQSGEPFEYELRVTNLTQDPIANVVVSDALPEGFELVDSSPAGEPGPDGRLQWHLASLGGGRTEAIRVRGTFAGDGTLENCAFVSVENSACATTDFRAPELALTMVGPESVLACDPIEYTVTVENTGSGTARDVAVVVPLPDGLETEDGRSEVRESIGDLAAGERREFTIPVRASGTGDFTVGATAAVAGGAEVGAQTSTAVTRPVLELDVACVERVFGGQRLPVRLSVRNTGDAPSANTEVRASIPQGTSFRQASEGGSAQGNAVVWRLGSLGAGESRDLEMTLMADSLGTRTIAIEAGGVCAESVTRECVTEVKGIPAILLEVVDEEDPIAVGSEVTYEIRVTNQGSAAAEAVSITCELEDTMEYLGSEGATGGTHEGMTVTFAPLPSLPAGARATWRATVRAVSPGDVRFKVTLTDNRLERPVEETEATNFYE